jgi:hypothetical protein
MDATGKVEFGGFLVKQAKVLLKIRARSLFESLAGIGDRVEKLPGRILRWSPLPNTMKVKKQGLTSQSKREVPNKIVATVSALPSSQSTDESKPSPK